MMPTPLLWGASAAVAVAAAWGLVESFPSLIVARLCGFRGAPFFEVETATERVAPEVKI